MLPKACLRPHCPNLANEGQHCPEHRRGTPAQRGYGPSHRRWRAQVLARDPLCVLCCRDEGRVTPSTIADHVIPLSAGGTWKLTNGQGVCRPCHNRKTAQETYAYD